MPTSWASLLLLADIVLEQPQKSQDEKFDKVHPIYNEPECNHTLSFLLNLALTNKPILSFSGHRELSSPASEATGIYELD